MWIKVAKLSDIDEGKSQIANANGKEIALFKREGALYALDNVCPHQGGPLGEGHLDAFEVICPWHAWTFDVRSGECVSVPDCRQKTFKVKIEKEDVFVELLNC